MLYGCWMIVCISVQCHWKEIRKVMTLQTEIVHLTTQQLEAGLDHIRQAPRDAGTLALIVRRPAVDEREVLATGALDVSEGLVGDNWRTRGSSRTEDGSCLLYTSPSPRDRTRSRMPSSA